MIIVECCCNRLYQCSFLEGIDNTYISSSYTYYRNNNVEIDDYKISVF